MPRPPNGTTTRGEAPAPAPRQLDEVGFQPLFAAAEEALQPILLLAFDTGMRKEEVLALRWEQVDLEASTIALAPEDTKTDEPWLIVLTQRA